MFCLKRSCWALQPPGEDNKAVLQTRHHRIAPGRISRLLGCLILVDTETQDKAPGRKHTRRWSVFRTAKQNLTHRVVTYQHNNTHMYKVILTYRPPSAHTGKHRGGKNTARQTIITCSTTQADTVQIKLTFLQILQLQRKIAILTKSNTDNMRYRNSKKVHFLV